MKRGIQPPADLREQWQIENAKRCGCGGSDDMCACQNEEDWFTRARPSYADLQAELATLRTRLAAVQPLVEAAQAYKVMITGPRELKGPNEVQALLTAAEALPSTEGEGR